MEIIKTRRGEKNKEIWKRSTQKKKHIVHARTYQQPEETRFVLFKKIIIIICGEFKKKMTIGGGGR
jgi:hypothetical protein